MVDRRPTATASRTVVEHAHDLLAAMPHAQMPAPWCHEHHSRPDEHAVGRLHDPHARQPVEPFGEAARELGRNVLHDEDRHWQIGGQEWNHGPQGLRATSRSTDHNRVEACRCGGPKRPLHRRRRGGHNRSPHALPDGGQLLGKLALDGVARDVQVAARGLEHEVEGALHQGGDRRRRSLCGETADHDRPWRQPTLLECPQHLDPVPARHLDVERDDVRPDPRDEFHCRVAVGGRSDNLHSRDPAEDREEHLPVEGRIVHHDNLENAFKHGANRDW